METTEKRTASAWDGDERRWRIVIEIIADAGIAERIVRQTAPVCDWTESSSAPRDDQTAPVCQTAFGMSASSAPRDDELRSMDASRQEAATVAAGAASSRRESRRTGGLSEDVRLCAGDVLEDLRQFVLDLDLDEMSVSCVLGAILRCWTRYGEKLTQSQLAELLGVSPRLISHALHGRRSPLVAARLAEAFGVSCGADAE